MRPCRSLAKYWLIPIWVFLQMAIFSVLAKLFYAGVIDNRQELPSARCWPWGFARSLTIVAGYIVFIIFVRREGTRYFRIQAEMDAGPRDTSFTRSDG